MKKFLCGSLLLLVSFLYAQPRNIVRGVRQGRCFYLTFDGHDDNRSVQYVLRILKKHNVKATFFLTGVFLRRFPDSARAIAVAGHCVANHTFNHRQRYSSRSVVRELFATAKLYKRITGKNMQKLWRAPYLQHLGRRYLLKAAQRAGYQHVDVSLSSRDWITRRDRLYLSNFRFLRLFKRGLPFERIHRMQLNGRNWRYYARFKRGGYRGVIMLYHLGQFRKQRADFIYTLDAVITHLKQKKYQFLTCNQFLVKK